MIGRGLVASPWLASAIKADAAQMPAGLPSWQQVLPWLEDFFAQCRAEAGHYAVARLKQWLGQLKRTYPEAAELFALVRVEREAEVVANKLACLIAEAA